MTPPQDGPGSAPEIVTEPLEPVSIPFGQFLKEVVQELDSNPKLSLREKKILKDVMQKVAEKHSMEEAVIQRATHAELDALKAQVAERITMRRVERRGDKGKLNETDLEDISDEIVAILNEVPLTQPYSRTDIPEAADTPEKAARRDAVKAKFDEVAKAHGIEGVETVADLRELPVDVLIQLEEKHPGILLYAFTDFVDDAKRIDLTHFEDFYNSPAAGVRLRIDFRGNGDAEANLGAGDILPPEVRRITCLEGGNDSLARTSERRVGLKGRNDSGSGFFDQEGYIPVFSSDIVVVGGLPPQEGAPAVEGGGIDLSFKKYRKEDGTLDYEQYAKDFGDADEKFLKPLRAKGARMDKTYTHEELAALEESIEASGVRQRIVSSVMKLIENKTLGKFCWDWADKVYKAAGAERGATVYAHKKYKTKKKFDPDNPGVHENPPAVKNLQPGDWLYIYNRNGFDDYDDHSCIFLKWIDKENLIAQTASGPGANVPGQLDTVDFKKTPATMVMKPRD